MPCRVHLLPFQPLPFPHSTFSTSIAIAMAFRSGLTSVRSGLTSLRRNNQIVSMDSYSPDRDGDPNPLTVFHSRVAQLLRPLHPSKNNTLPQEQPQVEEDKYDDEDNHLLTLLFLRKLLELLLLCDGDFVSILPFLSKSPSFRTNNPLPALFLRSLDILNAVSDALGSLRSSLDLAHIASSTFLHQPHRSRHALSKLLDSPPVVCRGDWSAVRQLQAMVGMLDVPRSGEATGIYAMTSVVVLSMWCLVAAFPGGGEEREEAVRLPPPPSQLPWAAAMVAVVENVTEEWKGMERERESLTRWRWRSSSSMPVGMLGELQRMQRLGKLMMEEELECEEAKRVAASGLAKVCREAEEEVGRLQAVVREVFHRMARRRAEVIRIWCKKDQLPNSDASSNG